MTSVETLPELLWQLADMTPHAPALRHKRRGVWATWRWDDVRSGAEDFACALRRLDLPRGSVVSILSENRPEWLLADLGTQLAGCTSHGVHPTWGCATAVHAVELARSEVLVIENAAQMRKLQAHIAARGFRRVVLLDERDVSGFSDCNVASWPAFLAFGAEFRREHRHSLRGRGSHAGAAAWLAESSGQSGPPRLCTVTQGLALEQLDRAAAIVGPKGEESCLSFTPLAQPAERALVYAALSAGTVVHFAEQPATVLNDLQEVQPHWVHAPPRFWEKQTSRIEAAALLAPSWARSVYRSALARAAPRGWTRMAARNIRRRLGLVRARVALSTGAAISPEILRWYAALGVRVDDVQTMAAAGGFLQDVRPAEPGEEVLVRDAERELRACCAIADALVFDPWPGHRVALLRPERDFLLACAQERQLPFTSFDDLLRSPAMTELLQAEMDRANGRLAADDRVHAFRVMPDLALDDDAVSATLRLRRHVIALRHAALLEEMAGLNEEAAKAAGFVTSVLRGLRSKAPGDATP